MIRLSTDKQSDLSLTNPFDIRRKQPQTQPPNSIIRPALSFILRHSFPMGAVISQIFNRRPSLRPGAESFAVHLESYDVRNEHNLFTTPKEFQTIRNWSPEILSSLESYTGCAELIRQAISNESDQTFKAAWENVEPCVQKLKEYYNFSQQMNDAARDALLKVAALPKDNHERHNIQYEVGRMVADAIRFDCTKIKTPSMQNDLSFYRRAISRSSDFPLDSLLAHSHDSANQLSMFIGRRYPMLETLRDSIVSIKDAPPQPNLDTLSLTMLSFIDGAFALLAKPVRHYLKLINELTEKPEGDELALVVKYNSKHLNDESTSKTIKAGFNR
ncbi:Protein FAM49 [Neolecta irregularis DAH-3]|uniref:Protein FAM49 n=1 Tax=Neolecta irregularis (strain DAH-3) TaxID=1198029 RepID=A0A1U7LH29_NEOID|nr:Protein FAM49 [Neolecta irregularis DAH-3]|eukprot:OLL21954.1 Protein FAM49 [Neolecta irregularis DAH-3]